MDFIVGSVDNASDEHNCRLRLQMWFENRLGAERFCLPYVIPLDLVGPDSSPMPSICFAKKKLKRKIQEEVDQAIMVYEIVVKLAERIDMPESELYRLARDM